MKAEDFIREFEIYDGGRNLALRRAYNHLIVGGSISDPALSGGGSRAEVDFYTGNKNGVSRYRYSCTGPPWDCRAGGPYSVSTDAALVHIDQKFSFRCDKDGKKAKWECKQPETIEKKEVVRSLRLRRPDEVYGLDEINKRFTENCNVKLNVYEAGGGGDCLFWAVPVGLKARGVEYIPDDRDLRLKQMRQILGDYITKMRPEKFVDHFYDIAMIFNEKVADEDAGNDILKYWRMEEYGITNLETVVKQLWETDPESRGLFDFIFKGQKDIAYDKRLVQKKPFTNATSDGEGSATLPLITQPSKKEINYAKSKFAKIRKWTCNSCEIENNDYNKEQRGWPRERDGGSIIVKYPECSMCGAIYENTWGKWPKNKNTQIKFSQQQIDELKKLFIQFYTACGNLYQGTDFAFQVIMEELNVGIVVVSSSDQTNYDFKKWKPEENPNFEYPYYIFVLHTGGHYQAVSITDLGTEEEHFYLTQYQWNNQFLRLKQYYEKNPPRPSP